MRSTSLLELFLLGKQEAKGSGHFNKVTEADVLSNRFY